MNQRGSFDVSEERTEALPAVAARVRALGSPLPAEVNRRAPQPSTGANPGRLVPPPSPGRIVEVAPAEPALSSGVQRTVKILRTALPFVQRLLPLLDGNIGSALSNVLAPRPQPQTVPPPETLDLTPIEDGLAELRAQQHSLRLDVAEQNTALRRVEDQLDLVREAADRNTLEQQELIEDMRAFGKKVMIVAVVALVLAVAGFAMTLVLFLRMKKMLP
jgi:hypothetical protein